MPRHFQQAEMRDSTDLDASAVVLERILQSTLHRAIVAALVHVNEVNDNEAGQISQAQLPGDFLGRLAIGLERGILDVMFASGASGVDVDRHQRFRLVDHDVAAGTKLHHRREHGVELALNAVAGEQRLRVLVMLYMLGVARHQHAHEVTRFLEAFFAGHDYFFDILAVKVADRALGK